MKRIVFLIIMSVLLLGCNAFAGSKYTYTDREQFDETFDTVARNFGAVEGAYYTYTLEFERVPETMQEMVDTGHLQVDWNNPYTGEVVRQTSEKAPGDLSWVPGDEDPVVEISAYYIDYNDTRMVRWMTKTILIYTHKELHKWIFEDGAPREEQLVRVYCLQYEDALTSYKQRFGEFPDTYEELAKGDVNVAYLNPITSKLVRNSRELSPGDFWYKKIDDEHFAIVGWGNDEPVYFFSNDRNLEDFEWEGETLKSPDID